MGRQVNICEADDPKSVICSVILVNGEAKLIPGTAKDWKVSDIYSPDEDGNPVSPKDGNKFMDGLQFAFNSGQGARAIEVKV